PFTAGDEGPSQPRECMGACSCRFSGVARSQQAGEAIDGLVQCHMEKEQRRRGRVAVIASKLVRHERQGARCADPNGSVLTAEEVVAVAPRQLADVEDLPCTAVWLEQ